MWSFLWYETIPCYTTIAFNPVAGENNNEKVRGSVVDTTLD